MFEFEWPWIFLALPLPWLLYRFLAQGTNEQAAVFMPVFFTHQQQMQESVSAHAKKARVVLLTLAWLCLLTSAAKPVVVGEPTGLKQTGRDMFLAVDLSGSMRRDDMQLNGQNVDRLTVVKSVVDSFIEHRQGDRLGLIVFGSQAFIQSPLSFDLQTVQTLLHEAQIGFAGDQTAIGSAIGMAIKRLNENPKSQRVVILLTDGSNNSGEIDPIKAAQLAKQESVVIYTIGIGSNEPRGGFFGFASHNPSADLDENTLKQIAQITEGQYFRATNQQQLQSIYKTIDALETIDQEAAQLRPKQDLFYWPLLIAYLLVALVMLLAALPNMRGVNSNV